MWSQGTWLDWLGGGNGPDIVAQLHVGRVNCMRGGHFDCKINAFLCGLVSTVSVLPYHAHPSPVFVIVHSSSQLHVSDCPPHQLPEHGVLFAEGGQRSPPAPRGRHLRGPGEGERRAHPQGRLPGEDLPGQGVRGGDPCSVRVAFVVPFSGCLLHCMYMVFFENCIRPCNVILYSAPACVLLLMCDVGCTLRV